MTRKDVRELGLRILDDERGVHPNVFKTLSGMLEAMNCQDVLDQVETVGERVYISEDFAEEALRNLDQWEKDNEDNED